MGDGWEVDSLHRVGLNHDQIKDVIVNLATTSSNNDFRSIIVVKNGKLVVEQYFNSYRAETIHDIRSAGKAFTGTLIGIAIDKGLIKSTTEKVIPFFDNYPEYQNKGNGKEEITVENLLNMSSGLDADVDDFRSPGNEARLVESDNFLKFVLDLPMKFTPGKQYVYNSATCYLAGAVVEKVSGMTLSSFADQHLFGLLDINQYFWAKGPNNTTYAMGNLYLTARDFAKLGYLYLHKGQWQGQQILSKKWVKETLRNHFDVNIMNIQLGYTRFFLYAKRKVFGKEYEVFYASGNGGNIMAMVPELDLIISFQQSAYGQGYPHFRAFSAIDGIIKACLLK
jgi:CubicO group peptidase (beta-lactamase class C family)